MKRKVLLISVFLIMLLTVGTVIGYYWYNNTYYVYTDDSTIQADLVKASTQISGKLLELNIDDGDSVQKGQIIARQDMGSLPDASEDTSLIRSPITGVIVKKQGTVGEAEPSGQTIATLIDPNAIYVTANIDETKLYKVRPGQKVDITVDEYNNLKLMGKVKTIGESSNSELAIIPTSTSGTFTKVVQKVPVKITVPKNNYKLLPGTNVEVKIHVR